MSSVELINSSLFSDANLQAYYKFEDANDSKNSYNLTAAGSPAYNAALFGNGADFGASNTTKGYDINSSLGMGGTTNVSFLFNIKLQTEVGAGEYDLIYFDTITNANRLCLLTYEYNAGTRRFRMYGSGTNAYYNIALGTTNWYQICLNIARGGGVTELFINGSSVLTGTSGSASGNGVDKLHIGKADTGSNWASCILDDMAVFSRVLTSTEVSNHYSGADSIISNGYINFLN